MYTLDLHSVRFYQRALRSLMSPLYSRLVSWSLSPQGKGMSIPNPCTSYRDLVWRTCINSVYGLHTGYFLTLCWSPIRGGGPLVLWMGYLGSRTLLQHQCLPCSTGMGHLLSMVPSAEAPYPVGSAGHWLLSEPCQYIPCPCLPTK